MKKPDTWRCLGGMLLIAGTATGAGMLALPIATGVGGFTWATAVLVAGFLYMLGNLFLLLEANLYSSNPEHNIISMTRDHLGVAGQITAWISFLLLLYAVSSAYISGGASLLQASWPTLTKPLCALCFSLVFGALAFFGMRWMDGVNRVLMIGLFVTYVSLVTLISPHIDHEHLSGGIPHLLWATIPMVALSFTSHIILPSLRGYLHGHVPSLKKVLIFGSCIPFVCYLLWDSMIIGILPIHGDPGLLAIAKSDDGLALLAQTLSLQHIPHIGPLNKSFSFFAMITSFLGVIISLFDFLADGLQWEKRGIRRIYLLLLTFLPPLTLSILCPSFVEALNYAGVMVAILYGIIPACIVWRARYRLRLPTPEYRFPGGRCSLLIIVILAIGIIGLEIAATEQWLPTPHHLTTHS